MGLILVCHTVALSLIELDILSLPSRSIDRPRPFGHIVLVQSPPSTTTTLFTCPIFVALQHLNRLRRTGRGPPHGLKLPALHRPLFVTCSPPSRSPCDYEWRRGARRLMSGGYLERARSRLLRQWRALNWGVQVTLRVFFLFAPSWFRSFVCFPPEDQNLKALEGNALSKKWRGKNRDLVL